MKQNPVSALKNAPAKHKLVGALVILLAFGLAFGVANHQGKETYKGLVETTLYSHIAEVSAKIVTADVQIGQSIEKGDLLFQLDDQDQRYAIAQLEQTLVQQKAALALLEKGTDQEVVAQAQNSASTAKAAYQKAQDDYERTQELYQEGAASKEAFDQAKFMLQSAYDQMDSAKQQVVLAKDGAEEETILQAAAAVKKTELQLEQMKGDLAHYQIVALCSGIVMSRNYHEGDLVAAGYDLADLASNEELFVVFYLPVDQIARVQYGDEVEVESDNRTYTGIVSYIDTKSEYTPKDLQTAANKNRESVQIKAKIEAGEDLKAGQELKVFLQ